MDLVKEWGYFIEGIGFVGLLSDVLVIWCVFSFFQAQAEC